MDGVDRVDTVDTVDGVDRVDRVDGVDFFFLPSCHLFPVIPAISRHSCEGRNLNQGKDGFRLTELHSTRESVDRVDGVGRVDFFF